MVWAKILILDKLHCSRTSTAPLHNALMGTATDTGNLFGPANCGIYDCQGPAYHSVSEGVKFSGYQWL